MVAETSIGKAVDVVVWRKGERVTLQVSLGELTDEAVAATLGQDPGGDGVAALGLGLAKITPELRTEWSLEDDVQGVLVVNVAEGGPAATKDVQPGDVIVEVDQEPVGSPADVSAAIEKAKSEGYRIVTLLVQRGTNRQWIAVRIDQG
jgi:serine protease Do